MEVDNSMEASYDAKLLPDLLPIYYQRLFPFTLYYRWLKYSDKKCFTNREFSFTLQDDVYLRYQSFEDDTEMKKEVVQKCPHKIDIGAVYSYRPREQRTVSNFHPLEKELVFDIDMTDYDEVRTCCSGADICNNCWPFMTVAMKILDRALREDFGFNHLLWVYSGRRGIHCWVCDKVARQLTPAARSAIVDYLTVVRGGEFQAKKVFFNSHDVLHPSLKAASEIISVYFDDLMLEKQGILETEAQCDKVYALCSDDNVKNSIKTSLPDFHNSKQRWNALQRVDETFGGKKHKYFIQEVMFQFCYPRLDINVTKGLNHLLKAPFCVHPKTGRVCVPLDIKSIDSFDPFSVPTIDSLCREIDEYDSKKKAENNQEGMEASPREKVEDYSKTSICKNIEIFKDFVNDLCSDYN